MRRALHLGAIAALLVAAGPVVDGGSPAAADCAGPTVSHETGTIDRGDLLTVEGIGFGDNCFDTGPPPEGQGVLGHPLAGITVFIVQGGDEHLVAEGAADADYEFTVEVAVPAELAPGEADVVVRHAQGAEAYDPDLLPFTVSDVAPSDPAAEEVVTFGPVETEPEVVQVPGDGEEGGGQGEGGEVTNRGGEGDPPLGPFIASGVVALGAVGLVVVLRKRQQSMLEPRSDTEPEAGPET